MRSLMTALLTGFLIFVHCIPGTAAEPPFDEIVVTATRIEIPRDRSLAPVIVIGRAEIERSLAFDVADLLRLHAGLEVARNGGPGQATSLFIRGAESNHTLVLLDGVEINPGTLGGAALQNIAPEIIERIEVVKGPRSALYGSEAIGGVVNIVTRDAEFDHSLSAGAGTYGTREAAFNTGLRGGSLALDLSAAWLSADGFPTLRSNDVDRGYDRLSVNVGARTSLGPIAAGLRHWQAEGTSEYSDFFATPVDHEYANRATAIKLTGSPNGSWTSHLTLSRVTDDIEQNQSMDFVATDRDTLDWQNDVAVGDTQRLVAGFYAAYEETSAVFFGAPLSENPADTGVDTGVHAFYLEDHLTSGRHALALAARYTDHDDFGAATTWNAEYGLEFSPATRFTFGAGTGFRAPDSVDRYGFGGNPELGPERSRNFELGLHHALDARQRLTVSLFHNEIKELIEFVTLSTDPFVAENRNVEQARIRGVEAAYELRGDLWRLRAAGIVQDAENVSDHMRLPRRARRSLTLSLGREIGRHELGLDILASGDREDFGVPAPVELGGYVLAGLTGRIALAEGWTLRARADNLFDADYETVSGFNTPGRSLHILLELDL